MIPKQVQYVLKAIQNPQNVVLIYIDNKWTSLIHYGFEKIDLEKIPPGDIQIHEIDSASGWISKFYNHQPINKV